MSGFSAFDRDGVAVPPIRPLLVMTPGSHRKPEVLLDTSPVFYDDVLSPWHNDTPQQQRHFGGKCMPDGHCRLPDGLMSSPLPVMPSPSPGLSTEPRAVLRDRGSHSLCSGDRRSHSEATSLVRNIKQAVFFSTSTPDTRINGHSVGQTPSETPSLLKQKQLQRMSQLQFEHPAVNITPQRLANPNGVLRDILNANFTSVKFTPKPPGTVPRRSEGSIS